MFLLAGCLVSIKIKFCFPHPTGRYSILKLSLIFYLYYAIFSNYPGGLILYATLSYPRKVIFLHLQLFFRQTPSYMRLPCNLIITTKRIRKQTSDTHQKPRATIQSCPLCLVSSLSSFFSFANRLKKKHHHHFTGHNIKYCL